MKSLERTYTVVTAVNKLEKGIRMAIHDAIMHLAIANVICARGRNALVWP